MGRACLKQVPACAPLQQPSVREWSLSCPPAALGEGVEPFLSLLCLSREEAKEMWEKREAEWAREQIARDRLMSEVIPKTMFFPTMHCLSASHWW